MRPPSAVRWVVSASALLALPACVDSAWAQPRRGRGDAAITATDASADARRTGRAPGRNPLGNNPLGNPGVSNRDALTRGGFGGGFGPVGLGSIGFGDGGRRPRGIMEEGGLGRMGGGGGGGGGEGLALGIGGVRDHRRPEPAPTLLVLDGGLSDAVVRNALQPHLGGLRACGERAGASDAGARAVQIRFVITPTGGVSTAPADFGVDGVPADVARCLGAELRRVVFPAPIDGRRVRVEYGPTLGGAAP